MKKGDRIVRKPSSMILRAMLAALVVAYGLILYLQWHPPKLSREAGQYQADVEMTMSGPSINYALQKLCWLLGNVVGALGIALMYIRIRSGLFMLLACPPLVIAAAVLGAPPAAYPGIEQTTVTVLWCATSAIWGCVVTYALLGDRTLFPKPAEDDRVDR
jgi:hypothetical protein